MAAILARGNDAPDRAAAEDALIELTAAGGVLRVPVGDDALWLTREAADARESSHQHERTVA